MASSSAEENVDLHNLSEMFGTMFIFSILQHCIVRCCSNMFLYSSIIMIGRWNAYCVADVIVNLERYHCGRW